MDANMINTNMLIFNVRFTVLLVSLLTFGNGTTKSAAKAVFYLLTCELLSSHDFSDAAVSVRGFPSSFNFF